MLSSDQTIRSNARLAPWVSYLVLGTLLALAGCDGETPTSPSLSTQHTVTEDTINVASITPVGGTRLRPGQEVTFEAMVSYELGTIDTGLIRMVIQDQTDSIIQAIPRDPLQDRTVERGSGTVSFSDVVTIPGSGVTEVNVFFPLFPAGATSTSTVAVVSFPVI